MRSPKTLILSFLLLLLIMTQAQAQVVWLSFARQDSIIKAGLNHIYAGSAYVMISQEDSLIFSKGYGNFSASTIQPVASVSKTFSALVILRLSDSGLLNLDDSIGKYLPQMTAHGKGSPTIRQCFSHTGGWPSEDKPGNWMEKPMLTLEQSVDSIAAHIPLVYKPGTGFLYGGVSMEIVGRIAEIVSKKDWNTLFRDLIAQPLGLRNTGWCSYGRRNPLIAGGACSTPQDIMRINELILHKGLFRGKRLLKASTAEELFRDQTGLARVISSPYPDHPAYNNPTHQDTIRYGFGTWLDIYNDSSMMQEQISADGAFGTIAWVDQCRKITGVVFTYASFNTVRNYTWQIIDATREMFGTINCNGTINFIESPQNELDSLYFRIYPGVLLIESDRHGLHAQVFDLQGKLIPIALSAADNSMDISSLAPGTYLLRVFDAAGHSTTQKFLKN